MNPADRLAEIEELFKASARQQAPYFLTDPQNVDMKWLIARVKKLTEALEKISIDLSYDYYPHEIARKALDEE